MKRILSKALVACLPISIVLLMVLSCIVPTDGSITGKMNISDGLPTEASFTTVEVWDSDGDGLDEIYLGGAGRTSPKTAGIRAYEYDPSQGEWSEFGSGLPDSSSGKYYGALGLGDLDGDGKMDIAAPLHTKWYEGSTDGVEIYTNMGGGVFSLYHTIDVGSSAAEVEIADMDGDGTNDIVVSLNGGVKVYYGTGSISSWAEYSPDWESHEIDGIAVGDLNGDGLLDIVGTPYTGDGISLHVQSASWTWESLEFKDVDQAFGIKISDLDGDGNNDVICGTRSNGIKAWKGNGGGSSGGTSFSWTDMNGGLPSDNGDWQQIELADIDGNGHPDLIGARNSGGKAHIYLNSGSSWSEVLDDELDVGGSPYGANFGDFNGDGQLDCAACSWGTGVDAWLLTGDGTTPVDDEEPSDDEPDDTPADDDEPVDGDREAEKTPLPLYVVISGAILISFLLLSVDGRKR